MTKPAPTPDEGKSLQELVDDLKELAKRHPWMVLVFGLPLWPVGTVVAMCLAVSTLTKRGSDSATGVDLLVASYTLVIGLVWPLVGFVWAKEAKRAAKAGKTS